MVTNVVAAFASNHCSLPLAINPINPRLECLLHPKKQALRCCKRRTQETRTRLLAIFGTESKEIIFSGDAVQDKAAVDRFKVAYGVMHRWRKMPDGTQVLLVGADNFAFPIPLKKSDGGQWFFDTAAGKEEILTRRIGRNELAVIDVCGAMADAQAEYFSQPHDGGNTKQFA